MASANFRLVGNSEYEQSKRPCLSDSVRLDHINSAVSHYVKAYRCTKDYDEKASAAKNVGVAASQGITLCSPKDRPGKVLLALQYFTKALAFGRKSHKKDKWITHVRQIHAKCSETAISIVLGMDPTKAVDMTGHMIYVVESNTNKIELYQRVFHKVYKYCVHELDTGQYGEALGLLQEYKEIICGIQVPNCKQSEFDEIHEQLDHQLCRAQALQKLRHADANLQIVLRDRNDRNLNTVLELVDWYNEIVRNTESKHLETTSRAYYALAIIYKHLLMDPRRAEECVFKAEAYQIGKRKDELIFKMNTMAVQENVEAIESERDSQTLRLSGNEHYKMATSPGTTPDGQVQHLHNALQLYKDAFKSAKTPEQRALSARNNVTVLLCLAKTLNQSVRECVTHLRQALMYVPKAETYGQMAHLGPKWHLALSSTKEDCVKFGLDVIKSEKSMNVDDVLNHLLPVLKTHKDKIQYCRAALVIMTNVITLHIKSQRYRLALETVHRSIDILRKASMQFPKEEVVWINEYELKYEETTILIKASQSVSKAEQDFVRYLRIEKTGVNKRETTLSLIDQYSHVQKITQRMSQAECVKLYHWSCYRLYQIYLYLCKDRNRSQRHLDRIKDKHIKETASDGDYISELIQKRQLYQSHSGDKYAIMEPNVYTELNVVHT